MGGLTELPEKRMNGRALMWLLKWCRHAWEATPARPLPPLRYRAFRSRWPRATFFCLMEDDQLPETRGASYNVGKETLWVLSVF